eukprot:TRINITY_DN7580_c0_g1_i2.p1 TRINITY_DN7580_c0_g1~~TRINITY_DN7580_c0_g1_i2.p1  ORF type:complete len:153 (+),score=24.55 TRINITY_DN7580_c0_g1_i2:68-460(+)
MAPEVLHQLDRVTEAADIWSLGITAIEMASGEHPFARMHPLRVLVMLPVGRIWPSLEGNFSQEFKDFVQKCLQMDPQDRPSADELLKHKFIARAKESSCLMDLLDRSRQRKAELDELKEEDLGADGWSFQ